MQVENTKKNLYKQKILTKILTHVPFDGWSEKLFEAAAKDLKTEAAHLKLYFEGGIIDVIDYFSLTNDKQMVKEFKSLLAKEPDMRIRDRIKNAVLVRLKIYEEIKTVVAKTTAHLSMPWNLPYSAKFVWRTADTIWREAANDSSTDFNYYTKRSLLAGIYTAVIIYWLADNSKGYKETIRFLEERIEDVMKIGKCLAKVKQK